MKRLIATSLSVMLLFASATDSAKAQTRPGNEVSLNPTLQNKTSRRLAAFNLVSLAYQGYLKEQGIPSYGNFISEYNQRIFFAKDIVAAGVQAHLLPDDTLMNQEYINEVYSQMLAFSSKG